MIKKKNANHTCSSQVTNKIISCRNLSANFALQNKYLHEARNDIVEAALIIFLEPLHEFQAIFGTIIVCIPNCSEKYSDSFKRIFTFVFCNFDWVVSLIWNKMRVFCVTCSGTCVSPSCHLHPIKNYWPTVTSAS